MRLAFLDCEDDEGDEGERALRWISSYGEEGDDWKVFRCYRGELPDESWLAGVDGILIAGSVREVEGSSIPWMRALSSLLLEVLRVGRLRVLASCFGAQLAAEALGGRMPVEVNRSPRLRIEVVRLAPGVSSSPLFQGWEPVRKRVLVEHGAELVCLPRGTAILASVTSTKAVAWTDGRGLLAWHLRPEGDVEEGRKLSPIHEKAPSDDAADWRCVGRRFLHGVVHGWRTRDVMDAEEGIQRANRSWRSCARAETTSDIARRVLAMNLIASERILRIRDGLSARAPEGKDAVVRSRDRAQAWYEALERAEVRVEALESLVDNLLRRADSIAAQIERTSVRSENVGERIGIP